MGLGYINFRLYNPAAVLWSNFRLLYDASNLSANS